MPFLHWSVNGETGAHGRPATKGMKPHFIDLSVVLNSVQCSAVFAHPERLILYPQTLNAAKVYDCGCSRVHVVKIRSHSTTIQ